MKRLLPVPLLLCACALLAPALLRAGEGKAVKTGGPYEVEVVKGVAYYEGKDADPERHQLDLYLPKGQKDFPVLFFVHGGAWRSGSKDWYKDLGPLFARNGIGVVLSNYRLSPKAKHPAHIEDVARAFAWTHQNIGKHGGRADRIFVGGHSAGGHLVALLATDASYLKAHKLTLKDIRGVIPVSGVYTILPLGSMFQSAFGKDEKVCQAASPLAHVKGKHPPALVIYADKDYFALDAMAEQFGKKLQGCECEVEVLKVADRDHISIMKRMVNEADRTTQAFLGFIARHSDLKLTEKK